MAHANVRDSVTTDTTTAAGEYGVSLLEQQAKIAVAVPSRTNPLDHHLTS